MSFLFSWEAMHML
uniref:Uncharacterized protein n=1 Tax=Rhizophora mucronata TaxID=61149 RepID=A0A2P2QYG6_RHIMU